VASSEGQAVALAARGRGSTRRSLPAIEQSFASAGSRLQVAVADHQGRSLVRTSHPGAPSDNCRAERNADSSRARSRTDSRPVDRVTWGVLARGEQRGNFGAAPSPLFWRKTRRKLPAGLQTSGQQDAVSCVWVASGGHRCERFRWASLSVRSQMQRLRDYRQSDALTPPPTALYRRAVTVSCQMRAKPSRRQCARLWRATVPPATCSTCRRSCGQAHKIAPGWKEATKEQRPE
jgi:hypothetical protein